MFADINHNDRPPIITFMTTPQLVTWLQHKKCKIVYGTPTKAALKMGYTKADFKSYWCN